MNEQVLRSGVHDCSRFFKREGEKNLQGMKGKGLRSHIHFEFAGKGNALSFLLISPVFLPDNFSHLANSLPVVLHHNSEKILFINGNITETKTSKALQRSTFRQSAQLKAETGDYVFSAPVRIRLRKKLRRSTAEREENKSCPCAFCCPCTF